MRSWSRRVDPKFNMTGVLIRRKLETDMHTGRTHMEMEIEIRVMFLQAK